MKKKWKSTNTNPPESGRYWCYIEEVTENGKSYFQWNCSYNINENRWNIDKLEHLGGSVLYWTELLDKPNDSNIFNPYNEIIKIKEKIKKEEKL